MSISRTRPTAPGWYPDPAGTQGRRWHDGQDWTGQVTLGEPVEVPGRGVTRLGSWLGRMLGLCGVLLVVLAAWPTWYWINPPRISLPEDRPSASIAAGQLAGHSGALPWAALALGVLSLVTVVTWLVWQYRLASSAPVPLRRSPAAHVWWWFVPVAGLWVSPSNIADLWRAYGRQRRGEPDALGEPGEKGEQGEQSELTPVAFSLWWAFVLAPVVLEPVSVLLLVRAPTLGSALSVWMGNVAATLVAGALAAFMARLVVRELSRRAAMFPSESR